MTPTGEKSATLSPCDTWRRGV